jgi:hypothetical protein
MLQRPDNPLCLSRQLHVRRRRYHRRQHAHATARAFAGARSILGITVQPKTQAEAAKLFASTPQYIAAAITLLEAEAPDLIERVLRGHIPLLEAAQTVRKRVRLIKAYREADRSDRKALGNAIGVDVVFDETVGPHL